MSTVRPGDGPGWPEDGATLSAWLELLTGVMEEILPVKEGNGRLTAGSTGMKVPKNKITRLRPCGGSAG